MVDFTKRLGKKAVQNPIDPIELYSTLDRASDKGPLRPVQEAILKKWHNLHRIERDVILKLHTGQGKTLIGLLILQSKMNEQPGAAVYLCPNNYLVEQTSNQAKQFGIKTCAVENDLPHEFTDGKTILVTSIQRLFNGRTKFGIHQKSRPVSCILMDDCHSCIDAIRSALTLKLARNTDSYQKILELFHNDLREQGAGTFSDIERGNGNQLLPIPYWAWNDRQTEILKILADAVDVEEKKKAGTRDAIWFSWPLIRDLLPHCQCVVSGQHLEMAPYLPPLETFGSYHKAQHRVFMSATVTDDSFLIKGLRLSEETIKSPLIYDKERWSGEKMVIIPPLIDESLDRSMMVNQLGKSTPGRKFGVVALVPSFKLTEDWKACGSVIADKNTITDEIDKLHGGDCEKTLVVVNRYDGIDLPDNACRLLVFDSMPYSENLVDLNEESCRTTSELTAIRTARTIEQGLGRSVRGEKDYCAVLIIGSELVKFLRDSKTRSYLSGQTQAQIEMGLEIAEMAREELDHSSSGWKVLARVVNQCLKRDASWKQFYAEQMDAAHSGAAPAKALDMFKLELEAQVHFQAGEADKAASKIQKLIDDYIRDDTDCGWYLQEMARYKYPVSKTESNKLQIEAHKKNRYLMKPLQGLEFTPLQRLSHKRIEGIDSWIKNQNEYGQLALAVEHILSRLSFGLGADSFEEAFKELGVVLGFTSNRPDKEWKEGPDNLWCLRDGEFLLVECKSEVRLTRAEINKSETGQMNNACAWFAKHYVGASATKVMIIPTNNVGRAAGFNEEVVVMRDKELRKLKANVKAFFAEFRDMDFSDLSEKKSQQFLDAHKLSVETLMADYVVRPKQQ